jgi:hypothetical protein
VSLSTLTLTLTLSLILRLTLSLTQTLPHTLDAATSGYFPCHASVYPAVQSGCYTLTLPLILTGF